MAFAMVDFDEEDHKKISIGNLMMIVELEKIKAEIMSIGNWREHYEMPIAYLSCLTIVENHISELKGE